MKPLKILIAEDDAAIREALAELLESEGHACRQAYDGYNAVEVFQNEDFDLLVSDFRMPRLDGVGLLEWCRNNGRHLPVIFITANRELFPTERLALSDCCAELLRKPIHIDELLSAVEAASKREHRRDCGAGPLAGEGEKN
jgi:DNA-binding response OmpR family regulator